ncbi:Sec9 protein [Saccharomycopsis crataegensis]|uniref:Sec9 protein n=1 Tax=Saccharomycopsis crataegensis TaxID=43959 RepID=A0AAV5QLM8_9ASCO|nr:Sec9 protein [Saccharomycopsis crataegensis]
MAANPGRMAEGPYASMMSVPEDKFSSFRNHARSMNGNDSLPHQGGPGPNYDSPSQQMRRGPQYHPQHRQFPAPGGPNNFYNSQQQRQKHRDPANNFQGQQHRGGPPNNAYQGQKQRNDPNNAQQQYGGPNNSFQGQNQQGRRAPNYSDHQDYPPNQDNCSENGYQRGYRPQMNARSSQPQAPVFEESYQEFKQRRVMERQKRQNNYNNNAYGSNYDADDLNAVKDTNADDLNAPGNYTYQQEQKQSQVYSDEEEEDDEELEDIKCELRFTRDKTIESTERTLSLAKEAEESGQNTMGMLGSQSARLFNAENNLGLAETSNRLGTEYAKELRTAANVFKAPSNPFNKKNKLRQREEKQRSDMIADQQQSNARQKEFQDSERRVRENLGGSKNNPYNNNQARGYQAPDEAYYSKYSYEGEGSYARQQEDKIHNNLNEIHGYARKLKTLANAQRDELERQDIRMKSMQQNLDNVTISVDQNTARLKRIVHG